MTLNNNYGLLIDNLMLDANVSSSPSSNDNFADSVVLEGDVVNTTGSNVDYTEESGEPYQSGSINSAWWNWTADTNGIVTIDTNGSNFDTYLSVFTGDSLGSLTTIAQNDDYYGLQSLVSFNVTAGTTYQIAVDGFGYSTGDIALN
ncbi:MAG: hypothetical protein AB4058_09655, partial [Microcystaceae cyanobacterium]